MELSVLKWLDDTAAGYGSKTAFSDAETSVTFAQFDALTKAVGTFLAGKTPAHTPVAVMSGRHVQTPAYFLGVVRAGCFYAPMDASMPVARLNQILGVIEAPYLLVDRENEALARTLEYSGEILVAEDILNTVPDETVLRQRARELTGESPLYVIFTSGSTGRPKGVITSHQSLMC